MRHSTHTARVAHRARSLISQQTSGPPAVQASRHASERPRATAPAPSRVTLPAAAPKTPAPARSFQPRGCHAGCLREPLRAKSAAHQDADAAPGFLTTVEEAERDEELIKAALHADG